MVDKPAATCKGLVYNSVMSNWKQGIGILLLIVAPVAVYHLWPSDEARIRKLVMLEAQALGAEDMEAVMKGISFLGELRCMALAISSFPVPLSPLIKIFAIESEARSISFMIS